MIANDIKQLVAASQAARDAAAKPPKLSKPVNLAGGQASLPSNIVELDAAIAEVIKLQSQFTTIIELKDMIGVQ